MRFINLLFHKLDNPTFSVIEGNFAGELTTDKKPGKKIPFEKFISKLLPKLFLSVTKKNIDFFNLKLINGPQNLNLKKVVFKYCKLYLRNRLQQCQGKEY